MNNQTFFAAINEAVGYDYVPDAEAENVVRTRDTVADFIKHQNLLETIKTSSHTIYCFEGNGGQEVKVIEDGEFSYVWID